MSVFLAIAVGAIFFWLGSVVAISFIEAPLKFRAPGVTVQIGLGIGRLVFRALNGLEAVLAAAVVVGLTVARPGTTALLSTGVAVLAFACQMLIVRPRLTRRSNAILAGGAAMATQRRSQAHYGYLALEVCKVAALAVGGIALLAGVS